MDHMHFEAVAQILTRRPSRRDVLRGLGGAGLGVGSVRLAAVVNAKKKRKHKKRKKKIKQKTAAPNAFGCIDVGALCQTAEQCCSGICAGPKGTKTCRAHDTGDCAVGDHPEGCGGIETACTTSSGLPGACGTTTGNAGYCLIAGDCYPCRTDADCQAAAGGQLGPTAACIQCADCENDGGTMCATTKLLV
jgi:hypothetical protein